MFIYIYFMYYIFIINPIFHLNKDFSLIYLLYKSDIESKSMFGEQSRSFRTSFNMLVNFCKVLTVSLIILF